MAKTTTTTTTRRYFITILSLLIILIISLHPHNVGSTPSTTDIVQDEEDADEYVIDAPFASTHRLRSRFLVSVKRGSHCDPIHDNVCNGVSANNGTRLLHCCEKHCRDVLGDRNNCGACRHKCGFLEHCCGGACINTAYSTSNCGKCNHACSPGITCHYGICGYA